MNEQEADVKILFLGTQTTLLGIFLLLMTQSVDVFSGLSADIFFIVSILLAGAGTAIVGLSINRQL